MGIAHLYRSISIILKLIWISIVLESCSEVAEFPMIASDSLSD